MEDIDKVFRTALKYFSDQYGSERKFALHLDIVSVDYMNKLLAGKRKGEESIRRRIAGNLGYLGRSYENFLDIGRAILEGREPVEPEADILTDEDLKNQGFLKVPFSKEMRLAAGSGGRIAVDYDESRSSIIVHGPTLGVKNARNLQAFRVGGPSMEPLIADGGIVLADLRHNQFDQLKDGSIYVLCWDKIDGECAVKRLRWADKGKLLAIESTGDQSLFPTEYIHPGEVVLVGKVVWSWRVHE